MLNEKWKPSIDHLKDIDCPTLILWGQEDRFLSVEQAYKFQEAIPNAETVIYSGVGHVPMEEIPTKSAMDVKSFLAEKKYMTN